MLYRKYISLITYFVFFIVTTACQIHAQDSNIIADIGEDFSLSFTELHNFHSEKYFEYRFPNSEMKGYDEALNTLITNRLKLLDFFEQGFHKDPDLIKPLTRIINEELIYQYYKTQFLNKYINEESIQEYYMGMGKEITYRQIVLRKPQNSPEELKVLKNKLDEIVSLAKEGENFGELVDQYSQHKQSVARGGFVSPVSWEQESSRSLFHQLYKLQSGDIKTLETGDSFYILKIESVKANKIEPINDVKNEIRDQLKELYGKKSIDEYNQEKNNQIDSTSYEWNYDALEQLVSWGKQKDFFNNLYKDILNDEISAGKNRILFSHSKGQVDFKELIRLLDEILIPDGASSFTVENYQKFIEEAVRTDLVVKKARDSGLENEILNPNSPSEVLKRNFVKLYDKKVIEEKLPEATKDNLEEFYNLNKKTLFYQLPKVTIFAKFFDYKEAANDMWTEIENGKTFEEAANKSYKVRTFEKDENGVIQSNNRSEKSYLGKAAFSLEENEISEPIEYSETGEVIQFVIIKSVDKLPEKQLEYSEVKNIEQKFIDFHRESLEKSAENKLKEKYTVEIYEDILKQKIDVKTL